MYSLARLSDRERKDVFAAAAAELGIRPGLIEKDYWVCVVLRSIFVDSRFQSHMVFKGGTSLSKAYNLIQRFSEDIDLVLDWGLLGLSDAPPELESNTKRDQFNKRLNQLARECIATGIRPELNSVLSRVSAKLEATIDPNDGQVLNIYYPTSFPEAYVRPEVRLEIGPLASWVPSSAQRIEPYVASVFREDAGCLIPTIAAERTFWEKATILH